MNEKEYLVTEGNWSKPKNLIGFLGILFVIATLFSCDVQDMGISPNQDSESKYGITSTSDQLKFNGGQQPYTFTHNLSDSVPVVTMPAVEVQVLLTEDRAERQQDRPVPPRFGKPLEVSLGPDDAGRWDKLSSGDRLWRLSIASEGAYSLNFIFDQYKLPPGGELFIYNEDKSTILGPFTEDENKPTERFSTLPVSGDLITLEYYEPAGERANTMLRVGTVVHAYRNLFSYLGKSESTGKNMGTITTNGFGDSESCNRNVNCPEGYGWQDESRSVAMVLLDDNSRICSGALVNNVLQDRTPYFLSAFHCADVLNQNGILSQAEIDDAEDWLFSFNYKSEICSDPISEPAYSSVSGATFRAGNDASDFLLLELSNVPSSPSQNPYFAGWDADGNTPSSSTMIHHPEGDIKKIAFDNDPAVSNTWPGAPQNSHWELYFDQGANEPGSSGAPYFDENHRIVGQHHGNLDPNYEGGTNDCQVPHAWGGKFSMS